MLIMVTISILGAVFMLMLLTGKIKIGGLITGYGLITVLPVIFSIVIPVGVLDIIFVMICISSRFKESTASIPLLIIIFEIVIIFAFSLIRLNFYPVSAFANRAGVSKNLLNLDSGKRLLSYSIYGNLFYSAIFITCLSYFICQNHSALWHILMHPVKSLGYLVASVFLMLFFPFMALPFYIYAIIGFIIVTSFITIAGIVFILSVNGVIRIIYASSAIRKKSLFYIILMAFPILNIFCMVKLCKLARIELNSTVAN